MDLRLHAKGLALGIVLFFICGFAVGSITLLVRGYNLTGLGCLFVALMFTVLLLQVIQQPMTNGLVALALYLQPKGKTFGTFLKSLWHKAVENYKTRFVPWLSTAYNTTWKGGFIPWVKATWARKNEQASQWWETEGGPKTKAFTKKYAMIALTKVKPGFNWVWDAIWGRKGELTRYGVAAILFFILGWVSNKFGIHSTAFLFFACWLGCMWAFGVIWHRNNVVNKMKIFRRQRTRTST